jgi:hypothetical protein
MDQCGALVTRQRERGPPGRRWWQRGRGWGLDTPEHLHRCHEVAPPAYWSVKATTDACESRATNGGGVVTSVKTKHFIYTLITFVKL